MKRNSGFALYMAYQNSLDDWLQNTSFARLLNLEQR